MGAPGRPDESVIPTPQCPFCRSLQVSTVSKAISESTYWRCHICGQLWNPTRLITTSQPRRW
jgi:transposase-like protein